MGDAEVAQEVRGLSERERQIVSEMLAKLESFDDTIAGWDYSVNAREKGVTMTFKFGRKCGVFHAIEFANVVEQSSFKLAQMCSRVLRLDDDVKALESAGREEGGVDDG